MGLRDLFKSNFARIAENTTKYYLELKNNYGDRFGDEASLLATAGVLDAQNYIFVKSPKIGVQEMVNMAREAASKDESRLTPRRRLVIEKRSEKIYKGRAIDALLEFSEEWESPEEEALVDFVISLEIELFAIDTPYLSRSDITAACCKKADTITRAIRKTEKKYVSGGLFTSATNTFMESPEFQPIRKQLGIKD